MSVANISVLCATEMDFRKPLAHGVLGIPGYVQFTSRIQRYVDLLAHDQERHARGRGTMKPVVRVNGIFCVMVTESLEMHFMYHFVNAHCV
ncbi:hypothetical protein ACQJBY_070931 [Aegilops geniculata]